MARYFSYPQSERELVIQGHWGKSKKHYSSLSASSADLDPAALESLASHPRVRRLSYDHEMRANLDNAVQTTGADQLWSNSASTQYSGKGITVAVIDSGI